MMVFTAFTLVVFQGLVAIIQANEQTWVYHASEPGLQPPDWRNGYSYCGGNKQSPIDIPLDEAKNDPGLAGLTLEGWDQKPAALSVSNNGHSATVTVTGNFTVSGSGLPGVFKVDQFHFHWGSVKTQGSEHTLSGKAFPIEQHIVMHNTKYDSVTAGSAHPDGLAVISVLFEIGGYDGPNSDGHKTAYSNIRRQLESITTVGSSASIPTRFTMKDILPTRLYPLYRYSGSLTTPGCNEAVTWTVLKNPISVPRGFVNTLRTLIDSHGEVLQDNFRPIQPLNGRNVTTYDGPSKDDLLNLLPLIHSHSDE